jgi:hypothetical protein
MINKDSKEFKAFCDVLKHTPTDTTQLKKILGGIPHTDRSTFLNLLHTWCDNANLLTKFYSIL